MKSCKECGRTDKEYPNLCFVDDHCLSCWEDIEAGASFLDNFLKGVKVCQECESSKLCSPLPEDTRLMASTCPEYKKKKDSVKSLLEGENLKWKENYPDEN
jgi:hypothetical protein